jgi:hypothetical protein
MLQSPAQNSEKDDTLAMDEEEWSQQWREVIQPVS